MQLKSKILYISFLFISIVANCQVVLSPITSEKREDRASYYISQKTTKTNSDTLLLPFFDDFFSSKGVPDTSKWVNEGGVYINNRFCTPNPPTYNVATFDGMNRFGEPYAFGSGFSSGFTDTLTSRFINLSNYTNVDSIYLSFYYQAGGIGELPDSLTDSLWVEFKNQTGNWEYIWSGKATTNRDFLKISLPLTDTIFFHNSFQFRFRATGNQSGAFDIWNVDYVYLNANRKPNDFSMVDVAFSQSPQKLLRRFSNMPYWQFFANPQNELSDSSRTTINNLDKNPAIVTNQTILFDPQTNTTLTNLGGNNGFIIPANQKDRIIKTALNGSTIVNLDTISHFGIKYFLTTQDQNTFNLPLKRNDTLVAITELADYVSYDDGSAEFGFGVNQRFAKVAQKYTLNMPDTLKSIMIHFAKAGFDRSTETITLRVWESISDNFDSIIFNKSVKIYYTDKMNGFYRYEIDPPILVNNTFYVGWRQLSNNLINIGFDIHNNANNEIFYTVNNKWETLNSFSGSLMIRPEMYRTKLLGIKPNKLEKITQKIVLYPNPTNGMVYFETQKEEIIRVFDMLGKQLVESKSSVGVNNLDFTNLAKGVYVVKIGLSTVKLIKE